MASPNTAGSDQVLLSVSKIRRDYRLSLALLLAGVVVVAGFYGFVLWANAMGSWSSATLVVVSTIGNAGFVLILVGAIFAGINWSLLRKSRRTP